MSYISLTTGEYYEGDRQGNDPVVSPRPSAYHDWNGQDWVFNRVRKINELIRPERNRKLAETDWTQLSDSSIPELMKESYKNYRQALRDFPQVCDPDNPAWPELSR